MLESGFGALKLVFEEFFRGTEWQDVNVQIRRALIVMAQRDEIEKRRERRVIVCKA